MATKENQIPFSTYDPSKFLMEPNFEGLDANCKYFEFMSGLFAEALHSAGLNTANPQLANMVHYNKQQKRENVDPPYVGRTYVFFTRPDCAFNMPNIGSNPDFEFLFNTEIGKQLMTMLTTPERLVGGSFAEKHQIDQQVTKQEHDAALSMYENMKGSMSADDDEGIFSASAATYEKLKQQNEALAEEYRNQYPVKMMDEDASGNKYILNQNGDTFMRKLYSWEKKGINAFKANEMPGIRMGYFNTRFIPLLTNTCIEAPAGRDLSIETTETAKDYFGNSLVYATDCDELNAPTEITFSFENMQNNAVFLFFYLWVNYIRRVARGKCFARYESIINRKIDYTSSFFVFVTDRDGITLKGWARGMGCFPVNLSMQALSHSREPSLDAWRNISIPFKVNKYRMMDPTDIRDFNFFSAQEWLRKPNFTDDYFSTDTNMRKTTFAGKAIFSDVTKEQRGVSGMLPSKYLTSRGAFYGNIDRYNDTWGGYPYVVDGNKFVWINPDAYKEKDLSYEFKNNIRI